MPSQLSKVRPKVTAVEKSKINTTGRTRYRWKYGTRIRTPKRKK